MIRYISYKPVLKERAFLFYKKRVPLVTRFVFINKPS